MRVSIETRQNWFRDTTMTKFVVVDPHQCWYSFPPGATATLILLFSGRLRLLATNATFTELLTPTACLKKHIFSAWCFHHLLIAPSFILGRIAGAASLSIFTVFSNM